MGLRVAGVVDRRVLFLEPVHRAADLVLVAAALRLDRVGQHGLRELDRRDLHLRALLGERRRWCACPSASRPRRGRLPSARAPASASCPAAPAGGRTAPRCRASGYGRRCPAFSVPATTRSIVMRPKFSPRLALKLGPRGLNGRLFGTGCGGVLRITGSPPQRFPLHPLLEILDCTIIKQRSWWLWKPEDWVTPAQPNHDNPLFACRICPDVVGMRSLHRSQTEDAR